MSAHLSCEDIVPWVRLRAEGLTQEITRVLAVNTCKLIMRGVSGRTGGRRVRGERTLISSINHSNEDGLYCTKINKHYLFGQ